jgi:predicted NUDIX family phosphoesterase/thymidylate kinase
MEQSATENKELEARIQELKARAEGLVGTVKSQARRAYVLEITGTPKAGKTSAIGMVESFFKTCGYRVQVLRERAELCPLPMKGHFFFNAWTTCTLIAEVLEHADRDHDLILLDRGFFDALVWLERQRAQGQVDDEEAKTFEAFALLDRWRSLVDRTIILTVEPPVADRREQVDRLIPRKGSLMNPAALSSFNAALESVERAHGDKFTTERVDASKDDRKAVAADLVERVLAGLEPWVDPDVVGLPAAEVQSILGQTEFTPWTDELWSTLRPRLETRRRSEAERDDTWVQLVACGVLQRGDRYFVFRRTEKEKIQRYRGRSRLLWRGCHVESEIALDAIEALLRERIQELLHVRRGFGAVRPLGLAFTKGENEGQHLGLFVSIPIENETLAATLQEKEFKTLGRRARFDSEYLDRHALSAVRADLESWSAAFVDHLLSEAAQ